MGKNKTRKRKRNANENPPQSQKPPETAMEEDHVSAEEKIANLMALNKVLLKERTEKRKENDTLVSDKKGLESELARYKSERNELRDKMDQISDEYLELNIDPEFVKGFLRDELRKVSLELGKEKDELEEEVRVLREIKIRFDLQSEEMNRLKEKESENAKLVKEKEVLIGAESEQRKEIVKLDETVKSLKKEVSVLQDSVMTLEESLDECLDKEEGMMKEFEALGGEKKRMEFAFRSVRQKMVSVADQMEIVNVKLADKEKVIEELSWDKTELEAKLVDVSVKADELTNEVAALRKECDDGTEVSERLTNEVEELRHALAEAEVKKEEADKALDAEKSHGEALQGMVLNEEKTTETTREELQKVKAELGSLSAASERLTNEVKELRNVLEEADLKKEKADKALDAEKSHGDVLEAAVLKAEKMIETTREELQKVKTELQSVSAEKNALASQSKSLSEKAILENDLIEIKKASDALKAKLEGVEMLTERSLVMLKSVVSPLSQPEDREQGGIKSYEAELDSIEIALRDREDIIANMKREAATMRQARDDARKKKDFWTAVSSVTAISAGVSFLHAITISR